MIAMLTEFLFTAAGVVVMLAALLLMAPAVPLRPPTTKRKKHTHAAKVNAIKDVSNGQSQKDVAAKYGISTGLMNDWIKNKDKILKAANSGKSTACRIKISLFPKVEAAVLKWLQDGRQSNVPINGVQLLERVSQFALLIPDEAHFKASTGWLQGFMNRNDVIFRTLKGEANSVNLDDVEQFKTEKLPDILQRYDINDIFNCDEAGLQFGATSKKTLTFKGDSAHGTKQDKRRLTLL